MNLVIDIFWLELENYDQDHYIDFSELNLWSAIKFKTGDNTISLITDRETGKIRDEFYCCSYGLARWFIRNWWFITSNLNIDTQYMFNEENSMIETLRWMCVPDLKFNPCKETDEIELIWNKVLSRYRFIDFVTEGSVSLSKEIVVNSLIKFIDQVYNKALLYDDSNHISLRSCWVDWNGIKHAMRNNALMIDLKNQARQEIVKYFS